ncbi:PH domain-containing protein [Shewanella sp. HL-SH4]|uniref:PH domain-containing protein n=1 Tax=Shewanella sp. HL-SH4 TaxID=3436240 RepID=UPI003EBD46BD
MDIISLSALGPSALYSLIGLLAGLLVIAVIVLRKPMPKNAKYASMGILLAVFGVFVLTLYQSYNSELKWDDTGVSLNLPLYSQDFTASDIDWKASYIADLAIQTQLQPKWRINGLGLPGYALGWFKLQNGNKALLSVVAAENGTKKVVIVPIIDKDYVIMISVEQPDTALALLHTQLTH